MAQRWLGGGVGRVHAGRGSECDETCFSAASAVDAGIGSGELGFVYELGRQS